MKPKKYVFTLCTHHTDFTYKWFSWAEQQKKEKHRVEIDAVKIICIKRNLGNVKLSSRWHTTEFLRVFLVKYLQQGLWVNKLKKIFFKKLNVVFKTFSLEYLKNSIFFVIYLIISFSPRFGDSNNNNGKQTTHVKGVIKVTQVFLHISSSQFFQLSALIKYSVVCREIIFHEH